MKIITTLCALVLVAGIAPNAMACGSKKMKKSKLEPVREYRVTETTTFRPFAKGERKTFLGAVGDTLTLKPLRDQFRAEPVAERIEIEPVRERIRMKPVRERVILEPVAERTFYTTERMPARKVYWVPGHTSTRDGCWINSGWR